MTFVCDVCGSTLSTERILKIHKETTKRCLKLQQKSENSTETTVVISPSLEMKPCFRRIDCQLCSKNILKCKYKSHLSSCKGFDEEKHVLTKGVVCSKESGEPIVSKTLVVASTRKMEEIKILEEELLKKDKVIEKKDQIIEKHIEEKFKIMENIIKTLEKKAFEPKTINKTMNNNKTMNIVKQYVTQPLDLNEEKCKETVRDKLELKHIKDGERGIANLVIDELIRDKKNRKIYIVCCTKKSNDLKYMDAAGDIVTDEGGMTFLKMITEGVMPDVNLKISDLLSRMNEEDREKFEKSYNTHIALGYVFTTHIANRSRIDKSGGLNPLREFEGDTKVKTEAEAKFTSKKMKDEKADRRKLAKLEEKYAAEEAEKAVEEREEGKYEREEREKSEKREAKLKAKQDKNEKKRRNVKLN